MTQQKKINVPGVHLSPSTIPKQVNRSSGPSVGSATPKTFGNALLNMGFNAVGSVIGGAVSNYYNKQAEARADARYRDLLRDTPKITADARRSAGLNPYGDAVLPGQVAQSTPDTSSVGQDSFQRATAQTLEELVAMKHLENETLVAKSQANLNDANAERARGQEFRDTDTHQLSKRLLELGVDEKTISNYVAAATAENEIAMSSQQLTNMYREGMLLIEDIANRSMDTQEKKANIDNIYSEIMYREVQAELARANINLSYAEVEQCFANISLMSAQELVELSEGKLNEERANHIKSLTAGQDIQNALDKKYGGAQRIVGMVTDSLNSVSGVVSSVADVLPWNALKGKLSIANKRADNAEKQAESSFDRGYRSGRQDKWEKEEREKYGY